MEPAATTTACFAFTVKLKYSRVDEDWFKTRADTPFARFRCPFFTSSQVTCLTSQQSMKEQLPVLAASAR